MSGHAGPALLDTGGASRPGFAVARQAPSKQTERAADQPPLRAAMGYESRALARILARPSRQMARKLVWKAVSQCRSWQSLAEQRAAMVPPPAI